MDPEPEPEPEPEPQPQPEPQPEPQQTQPQPEPEPEPEPEVQLPATPIPAAAPGSSAWSPDPHARPVGSHAPTAEQRGGVWRWVAWRLRDLAVVEADEVVPASEVSSDSELVMVELRADLVRGPALAKIKQGQWRTVQVTTAIDDYHSVVFQVDAAGRAMRRRVDDLVNEVRGHSPRRGVADIIKGKPFLLHSRSRRMLLWTRCFESLRMPTGLFRSYFGDRVSLYFEMTDLYIQALQPLAVAGVALWLAELRAPSNVVTRARVVFRVLTNIWAVLAVWAADRQQKEHASRTAPHHWGSIRDWRHRIYEQNQTTTAKVRKGGQRLLCFARSCTVTVAMLGVAFASIVACLNLQGEMNLPVSAGRGRFRAPVWARRLRVAKIARFSEAGAVFDSANTMTLRGLVPTLVHSTLIGTLNKVYRAVAVFLTHHENHKTTEEFQNHLVFKRSMFEAMDTFLPLVYVTASLGGGQRDFAIKRYALNRVSFSQWFY